MRPREQHLHERARVHVQRDEAAVRRRGAARVAARLREKRMQQPVPHAHRARVLLAPGAFRAPRGASPSARGGQRVEQRSDDRGQQLPS